MVQLDPASVQAFRPGQTTLCSYRAGWRSLLVRAYREPLQVEELKTTPTQDHLIVLVTKGACEIEVANGRHWLEASYRAGHLGMTAPLNEATLRWRGVTQHETLQVHIPAQTIEGVEEQLRRRGFTPQILPNDLSLHDGTIEHSLRALARALKAGVPDLYAETASFFLATHLLTARGTSAPSKSQTHHEAALKRVDDFMRAHLCDGLSLAELADVAGYTRFQLLRLSSKQWGETPFDRLTRLRLERAQLLLKTTTLPIMEVALRCGFSSQAYFATAFRKRIGTTPSIFRKS